MIIMVPVNILSETVLTWTKKLGNVVSHVAGLIEERKFRYFDNSCPSRHFFIAELLK